MKIAVFLTHPIQHYSPLWKELSTREGVELKVFYYSRHGTETTFDPGFGMGFKWDVDLLEGYESEFLPRQWPTKDPFNSRWHGLNQGIDRVLAEGWDYAFVTGYSQVNNWRIANACQRHGVKLVYHSDSNFITEARKPRLQRALKKSIVGRFFSKVSVFLAVGDHNVDYLKYYGAPSEAIHFCAIPVDTSRFRSGAELPDEEKLALRRSLGIPESAFVVGFAGKMIDIKRPQDMVAALAVLDQDRFFGLFIGGGPLEEETKRAAGKNVKFAGFINQLEMPRMLSLCDVLVVSSERDAHPLAVTEVQSMGIPVVLSDRCGCAGPNDVFRDGESGILYPCGDVQKLADAVKRIADDDALRSQMGKRGRVLAELHSPENTASNFMHAIGMNNPV